METRGSNGVCRKFTPQDDSDDFCRACGYRMIFHRNDHGHAIAGVRSVAKPARLPRTDPVLGVSEGTDGRIRG
ncbi:hypothetical protein B296_00053718 [Ensete ventricosum]|uniref:Uncharacterized protein n=1 Tax=Ensete ventricosum TaxID=4639 RepID=A0A426Y719_ENSVE|nr:hypothetical protein B296_00053718 [Ensete ventricosum]